MDLRRPPPGRFGQPRTSRRAVLGLGLGLAGLLLGGCEQLRPRSPNGAQATAGLLARPAANQWPLLFWQSDASTQKAYRYAIENRDALKYIPCYCGCGESGHPARLARDGGKFVRIGGNEPARDDEEKHEDRKSDEKIRHRCAVSRVARAGATPRRFWSRC